MTDVDTLTRLQRMLDEHDIAKLIASYGPAVDAGQADDAARLWAADGTYDVEGWQMAGRRGVRDMVASPSHQELVASGCCHFLGPAVVTVEGNHAVAVCESLVLLRRNSQVQSTEDYRVWRATANHFVLDRIDGDWQIIKRTSRILDGDPHAHALLAAGLHGIAAPTDERDGS